jgi:chromosome segregation ATPase
LTDDLADLPGRVQAELTRLRAERQLFTAEQDRLKARLADTEHELQTHLAGADQAAGEREAHAEELAAKDVEIAELTAQLGRIAELEAEHRVTAARAEALESDVATVRRERDSLRSELLSARAERDRLRLRLLDAELAIAAGEPEEAAPESTMDSQRVIEAERKAGELARELAATHETLSWRVTRPLRAVRRKIPRS